MSFLISFLWVSAFLVRLILCQQGSTCSASIPCLSGCCSQSGQCGFGPSFCGGGCLNNCNAIAECGLYGNNASCPLNVCCSQYGFCGTTEDFCKKGCQDGCTAVNRPSCSESTDAADLQRRIAYYELSSTQRLCDFMEPEQIPAGALTHINIAFALIDSNYSVIDSQGDIVARISRLKKIYPRLRVNIAIGGWDFNDPPNQAIFSDLAGSAVNRQTFTHSLISYLQKYGLDGVDIDWEYPAALDRGGSSADFDNYVLLLSDIRDSFNGVNPGWEITITLPSSYWYLRGFNLPSLQRFVSWFNLMSYDLHGMWDQFNQFTGPFLLGHTNVTEIDQGLDLLWRNQIEPRNVVMGMAFYGRSFTMANPTCYEPGCQYSATGVAGDCSATAGILLYPEIQSSNNTINSQTYYDAVSTVKYSVFDGTQWVSYDDEQSFTDKKAFLSSRCLSGLMIWAVDEDTQQYDAITGLLGNQLMQGSLLQGGSLDESEKIALAGEFGAYTGQDCVVTKLCTDGSNAQSGPNQVCPTGTTSIATAHAPFQAVGYELQGACSKGWYRQICCPTSAIPQNCQWTGVSSEFRCSGSCGSTQFSLNIDTYVDANGGVPCRQGQRSLCCDSTELVDECFWTPCQGPISSNPECPLGSSYMTYRYDDDNGQLCSQSEDNSPIEMSFKRAYCCPTADAPSNCSWSNDPNTPSSQIIYHDPAFACQPQRCDPTQIQYTSALDPPNSSLLFATETWQAVDNCNAYPISAGQSPFFPYCCNPPEAYNEKWPVDPKYLWQDYYDASGDDVEWSYIDNFGNLNSQTSPSDENGDDPYGFVMLDGPPGSLDNTFSSDFTVVNRNAEIPITKRSFITTNRTVLDSVFEHKEETIHVYCNHEERSSKCAKVFYKGVEDTIIRLPAHVGEGPFGRVVSMDLAESFLLPYHHVRARSADKNTNPVYKLVFDYNFHLIKRNNSEPVNMRVDYTNLLGYWSTMTDSPGSKKRSVVLLEDLSYTDWRLRVQTMKKETDRLRKRAAPKGKRTAAHSATAFLAKSDSIGLSKRWFGTFVDWLSKLNTVQSSTTGWLNLGWQKSMLLYHAVKGCSSSTAYAELSMYLDADVNMRATYAYYFSGTLVPPAVAGTYAYVGMEPSAYFGLTVSGLAKLQYQSDRVKLIQTLSWPGLAIKGIAAVGPTLDIWGQIQSVIQLSGQMQVGVQFSFEKQEWYWPEDADSASYQELLDLKSDPEPIEQGIVPQFSANVQASADLDVLITPEVKLGIQVGGSGTFGVTLVDAQVIGYVNTTLRLHADSQVSDSSSGGISASYNYGAYLLYNIGYGAIANIPLFPWYSVNRDLFNPPKQITLYSNGALISSSTKRDLDKAENIRVSRRGLFNSLTGSELQPVHLPQQSITASNERATPENSYVSNSSVPLLNHRQIDPNGNTETGQTPELSLYQFFDCPQNAACSCSTCGSSSKRDTGELGIRASSVASANSPCGSTLPDFRINCAVFGDAQVTGNKITRTIPGICTGEQNFLGRRALPNTGLVLTYDSDKTRANVRRKASCGRGGLFCEAENTVLGALLSYYSLVSCDEFPFATTEEGGLYFGTLPQNPTAVGALCVPTWQQIIQGSCNTIFSQLSTNVAYADNKQTPTWVSWGDVSWTSGPNNPFNRLALYPSYIYQAGGIPSTDYLNSNKQLGYMFKRNFTYGLAFPASPNDGTAWGSQAFTSYKSDTAGFTSTDATTVLCSMNIFGQNNIYRYDGYNALCVAPNNLQQPSGSRYGFGFAPSFVRCKVSYINSPGPTKRSIGEFSGWKIESVEIDEDAEPLGYIPEDLYLGESMPVTIIPSAEKRSNMLEREIHDMQSP